MHYSITIPTKGFGDIIDITPSINKIILSQKTGNGLANIFVVGSTASLTTIEPDERLYKDFLEMLEKISPYNKEYYHHITWGDDNGAAHIRASLIGPSVTIPFEHKKLMLGTWQKIVLIDFDTRPRQRDIYITVLP